MRSQGMNVDESAAVQTEEMMLEHEAKERRRVELENRYGQQKNEYIRLNNLEGELHS